MDFERIVFDIAPYAKEMMLTAKNLPEGRFLMGRSGWIIREVFNPETIYDHVCKVGLAAWYRYRNERAVVVALSHELPELRSYDYMPGEIDPLEKQRLEYQSMLSLRKDLPNWCFWFDAWEEYEHKKGYGEGIGYLDKVCPAIQAIDYINAQNGHNLDEFYPYAKRKVDEGLRELLDHMYATDLSAYETAYLPYFQGLDRLFQIRRIQG